MIKKIKHTVDGFVNILKGLGGNKDPRTWNRFAPKNRITQIDANNLYSHNWLAQKVVDCPVDDATRKWREFLIEDDVKKKEVEDVMKAFDVKGKVNLAAKWSRVFGGSVIIIVIDGDDQEEPLDLEKIKPNSLSNLIVLDRYSIFPDAIDMSILSKNFGKPEYYTVVEEGQRIHHSRVITFLGKTPTIYEWRMENYWGLSIFSTMWEPIEDSQVTSQAISDLVYDANVDVYGIKGLNAMVAEGQDDLVIKRLKIAHEMKSIINGIAIDSEDTYDKKSNVFASLPDIDDRGLQKVAGASKIPVTKLLGISPAGQNATGESDRRNYYDDVSSYQENELRPRIDIIDTAVIASELGWTDDTEYVFLPLHQLTETEQAAVDYQNAQRDQIYIDAEVIEEMDAMAQLAQKGTYVSIDANRVEEEKKAEELEELFEEEIEPTEEPVKEPEEEQ